MPWTGSSLRAAAVALAPLLAAPRAARAVVYSRLEAGSRCWDYRIADVTAKDACFGAAATALGLGGITQLQIDGMGFNGCAFNAVSGVLIFSVTPSATPGTHPLFPSFAYICDGVPTTTSTATATATTQSTTTTSGVFAMLEGGSSCSEYGIPDVVSQEVCFATAVHFVGLVGTPTLLLDNLGFTGCVYNSAADTLMYGTTSSVPPPLNAKLPAFRYVCSGLPTTTSSTTTSTATTTSSSSSTSSATGLPTTTSSTPTTTATTTLSSSSTSSTTSLPTTTLSSTTTSPTTTSSSSSTPSTTGTTTPSTSASTTTAHAYSRLPGGQRCLDQEIPGVFSREECFGPAAHHVGLGGRPAIEINSLGFTGCVYNAAAGKLMFGITPGVTPATTLVQPTFEYICDGEATLLLPVTTLFP